MKTLLRSLGMALVLSVILGLAYPLAMTGLAQFVFPSQAHGSLIRSASGTVLGSALIGQDWSTAPGWFVGRPSATGSSAYNAMASGGSNLTPHGKVYTERTAQARTDWETRGQAAGQTAPVPSVLLTTSGSGLDPHLALDATLWQVPLVALARGADPEALSALVKAHVEPTGWPWDPPAFVNLLALNLDLDRAFPKP